MLFISPQRPFSLWRYLNFCLDFLVMYQNALIAKIRLIWKLMTSQPGWQNKYKLQIFATASSKEFLDIQATIECGLTLKCIRDMTRTYIQMHHTDKHSEHSSIIYFRFRACFEKDVPWNLGNYRMWIHCETVNI